MKVILINPLSELAETSDAYYHSVSPLPPLGLAYLSSALKNNGFEVSVEDQYASRLSNERLIKKIKRLLKRILNQTVK